MIHGSGLRRLQKFEQTKRRDVPREITCCHLQRYSYGSDCEFQVQHAPLQRRTYVIQHRAYCRDESTFELMFLVLSCLLPILMPIRTRRLCGTLLRYICLIFVMRILLRA